MQTELPNRVKAFVALCVTTGAVILCTSLAHIHVSDPARFSCYLAIGVLAATLKVRLPGMESNMSVHFLFVLLGIMELSLGETLVIASAATLVQSLWKTTNKPQLIKVAFNVLGVTVIATFVAFCAYRGSTHTLKWSVPFLLIIAACVYFFINTLMVSIVIGLSEKRQLRAIWSQTYFWSLPYYLVGAVIVGLMNLATRFISWQCSLLIVPVMYGVYRSYHLYLSRLESEARQVATEKRHVEELCALHVRTIEALALAIGAKDHETHSHLHRVRTYAVEIGKALNLAADDLDALRAGALLHDIGKLAIPEHIINKPGRLTAEEFEKVKIHPAVGAQILETVAFPYAVAPIVRSHHEKWNGAGYPDGLKGEEIPIGARILSVVDCLDALTSDRPYRKALPLEDALAVIVKDSGSSFDPQVVGILLERYQELELLVVNTLQSSSAPNAVLQTRTHGKEAPATGIQEITPDRNNDSKEFLGLIASARHEAHTLFELSQELGNSLSLEETLSLVAIKLKKLIPFSTIAAFLNRADTLKPAFVSGTHAQQFASLEIPVGTGLCGWVARNGHPIINGDPSVETSFGFGRPGEPAPCSALVVPLQGTETNLGVLALYSSDANAFNTEHLRLLQVVIGRLTGCIENALKYEAAEQSATLDHLTGMPNVRALSVYFEQELANCIREGSRLAVMVCDLNGFKKINDSYGHLAGDQVLTIFGASVMESAPSGEYAARMGGDEFVIITKAADPQSIAARVAGLSDLAHGAGISACGSDSLSLSLGLAFYPDDGAETDTLLSEADKRMYALKRTHHTKALQTSLLLGCASSENSLNTTLVC